jgi:hypothetical protein
MFNLYMKCFFLNHLCYLYANVFDVWLGLWCLTSLSSIFQKYRGGGGNRSARRKPPTCRMFSQTLSHKVVSTTPRLSGIRTHNLIDIDCIGSCKSNFHSIMTTTVPLIHVHVCLTNQLQRLSIKGQHFILSTSIMAY